jgi:hypothetical protein
MIFRSRGPDGQVTMRRPAFAPGAYAVPERTLAGLRAMSRMQSFEDATTARDGILRGYTRVEELDRDGRTIYLYQANGSEHCVAIEVANGAIVDVQPLAPDRAWQIALDRDRQFRPGMIYDWARRGRRMAERKG